MMVCSAQLPETPVRKTKTAAGKESSGTGPNLGHLRGPLFFSTQKDQAVGTCHTHVQLSQPSLAQGRFDLPEWAGGVEPAARGRQAAPELVDKLL